MSKIKGASLEQAMPDDNDHQTMADMDTMHRASEVAADSDRLGKVHKLAGRKHKALQGMLEPMMKSPKKKKIKNLDDLKAVASKPLPDDMDE